MSIFLLSQINTLVELCVKYLEKSMSELNCLAAMTLAEAHVHKPMYDFALRYACLHFDIVKSDEDFVKLSTKCIIDLLKDRRLKCSSEEEVILKISNKGLQYICCRCY